MLSSQYSSLVLTQQFLVGRHYWKSEAGRCGGQVQQPLIWGQVAMRNQLRALKMGPLKSEAQGLDLSVNIAGNGASHAASRFLQ
jgi:hypothetical protein